MEPLILPFGRGTLTFQMPAAMRVTVAEPPPLPPVPDIGQAIAEALARPTGSPRLYELARNRRQVCIVVPDATRTCPDTVFVPALLKELSQGGVLEEDITILIGLGMHRPTTPEEKLECLGPDVLRRLPVVDHDPSRVVSLGQSSLGVPLWVSRTIAEADLVIATGIVEPHPHAGFSGGGKTVAIGAGGEETIAFTHSPQMLDRPGVRLGNIQGNPFQETVREGAERAGLRFVLNAVLDGQKRAVAVAAGAPAAVHDALVETAKRLFLVAVPRTFDAVIAGVGYPKDQNLYQATRAAINIVFAPRPAIKRGGTIVIAAPAPEGAGQGVGEQRFRRLMQEAVSPAAVVAELQHRGCQAGEQAAYLMAQTLLHAEVVIVGAQDPAAVAQLHLVPAGTMEQALLFIEERHGREAHVLVVPQALLTIPVLAQATP